MNKYCLPIIKNTSKEIEKIIDQYNNDYHYFEIWLDYLTDMKDNDILLLAKKLGNRGIFLFRRQHLESIRMSIQQRKKLISLLVKTDVYIDLDISTQQEELTYINTGITLNLLTSYHNYQKTPDEKTLHNHINIMESLNPAIYKIATYCKTQSDALRLLKVQQKIKKQNKRHIILGMGEHGIITRIFGTHWGNEMIFAPLGKNESSAPGQLTKSELEKIFEIASST